MLETGASTHEIEVHRVTKSIPRFPWIVLGVALVLGTFPVVYEIAYFPGEDAAPGVSVLDLLIVVAVMLYAAGLAFWFQFRRLAEKTAFSVEASSGGLTAKLPGGSTVTSPWAEQALGVKIVDWTPRREDAALTLTWKAGGRSVRAALTRRGATQLVEAARTAQVPVHSETIRSGGRTRSVTTIGGA